MALRAGYYGLKNSVKKKLEKLAADTTGMKIIKTIGDGLNLTNAGKLNVTAATASKIGGVKVGDTLTIEDGVLDVVGAGMVVDTLYTQEPGNVPAEAIELEHPYTDYKFLYFQVYDTESSTYVDLMGNNLFTTASLELLRTGALDVSGKTSDFMIYAWMHGIDVTRYTITDTTHFARTFNSNNNMKLLGIYGIK